MNGDQPSLARRRYTLMLVPERGRSKVWQVDVTLGQVRLVVGLVGLSVLLALVGAGSLYGLVSRSSTYSELLDENLSLKGRLREIEGKLDQVDRELRRLRMYDTELKGQAGDGAPGFGPLDPDDLEGAPWLGVGIEELGGRDLLAGELGDPMGEAGLDALPVGSAAWADALSARTDAALADLLYAGVAMGDLVESAEEWRAMRDAIPTDWPLEGILTSGFGYREAPFSRQWKFHRGIDISAPRGTEILAPAAGLVIVAEYHSGYGRTAEIDHGFGIVTRYAHASQLFVEVGDEVERGEVIATVGMTGRTTGPHLHYELLVDGNPIDPLEYLE